jgi:hypothetical protein
MRILILYFPWVNDASDASPEVPFINNLWQPGVQDWKAALLSHARQVGCPSEEVRCLVLNFVFTHCLPRETRLVNGLEENSDNEDMTDELTDFKLEGDDLLAAIQTHVRGSGLKDPEAEEAIEAQAEGNEAENAPEQAGEPTKLYDMTMRMFGLSRAIWQQGDGFRNEAAQQRHSAMLCNAAACNIDPAAALAAAKRSAKQAKKDARSTGLIGALEPELEAGLKLEVSFLVLIATCGKARRKCVIDKSPCS